MWGISWLTEELLPPQEGFCSMQLVGWMVSCLFVCLSVNQSVSGRPADETSMSIHNRTWFENTENCHMINSRCETLKPYRTSVFSSATQEYDVSHIVRSKSCNHGMDLSRIRAWLLKKSILLSKDHCNAE